MNNLIKQRPAILPDGDKWMVRDIGEATRGAGTNSPFGPVNVSREEAEAWLADGVRVIVVAVLKDHTESYGKWDDYGNHPCRCGEKNIVSWDCHHADMIADRLHAAGIGVVL